MSAERRTVIVVFFLFFFLFVCDREKEKWRWSATYLVLSDSRRETEKVTNEGGTRYGVLGMLIEVERFNIAVTDTVFNEFTRREHTYSEREKKYWKNTCNTYEKNLCACSWSNVCTESDNGRNRKIYIYLFFLRLFHIFFIIRQQLRRWNDTFISSKHRVPFCATPEILIFDFRIRSIFTLVDFCFPFILS